MERKIARGRGHICITKKTERDVGFRFGVVVALRFGCGVYAGVARAGRG